MKLEAFILPSSFRAHGAVLKHEAFIIPYSLMRYVPKPFLDTSSLAHGVVGKVEGGLLSALD